MFQRKSIFFIHTLYETIFMDIIVIWKSTFPYVLAICIHTK